jgi:hypothetical protein
MTDDSIALRELLEKSSDADLLREMIGFAAERLMELEVEGLTGAAHGESSPDGGEPAPKPTSSDGDSVLFRASVVSRSWWNVWRELGTALWKSAVVTVSSAARPVCVVARPDFSFDLSIPATMLAVLLAAIGWLSGVFITQHPVVLELTRAAAAIAETGFARRVRGRIIADRPRGRRGRIA